MKPRHQKTIFFILILLFAWAAMLHLAGRSNANPIFMGRLASVHPFGAQDVVRNPALIVWQQQNNALGLLLDYQADINTQAKVLSSETIAGVHADNKNGLARLSYIYSNDMIALGWDISASYGFTKQRTQYDAKINSVDILNRVRMDTGTTSAFLTFSAAVALDSSHSLGLQVIAGYSKDETASKTISYLFLPFPPFFDIGKDYQRNVKEQVTASPGIGYLGKIEKSEIGLMITFGRLTWEKGSDQETIFDAALLASKVKARGKLPFYFRYDVGPGLLAGSFSKLCDYVNAGLELEIIFPLSYKTQFLEQFGNSYPSSVFIKSEKLNLRSRVTNRPFMSIRGGFEFLASSNIIFSLGGRMGLLSSRSRTLGGLVPPNMRDDQSYQKIESVYGTAGIDFVFGKHHTITLGTVLSHNTISIEENRYQKMMQNIQEPVVHLSNSKIKALAIDAIIISSFGF